MNVAIYIRVSTEDQVEEGYSLPEQRRICEAYAATRGWTVAQVYADEGLSAFKDQIGARPALAQLLKDVRIKRYGAVIVQKLDRFFRRTKLLLTTVEDLEAQRCAFVSVAEQVDFTTPHGRMLLASMGSFAEYTSRNLSMEVAKGLRGKARAGDWVGPTPYGYQRDGKSLKPNDDAPVAARIFELYATGVHSYTSIADVLNESGCTTFDWMTGQRGRWGRENVRGILHNPAYIGMVRCKELTLPAKHEPLISTATWERCQAILAERQRLGGFVPVQGAGTRKPGRLLSGMGRCEVCGKAMWVNQSFSMAYYRCSGIDSRTCNAGMTQAALVEERLLAFMRALIVPSADRALILSEARYLAQPEQPSKPIDPAIIEKQLERLALVWAAGDLSTEAYDAERVRLKRRLTEQNQPVVSVWDASHANAQLDLFASIIDGATQEEQRALARLLFRAVYIEPHEVVAYTPQESFAPLFLAVEKRRGVGMGCPMGLGFLTPIYYTSHRVRVAA